MAFQAPQEKTGRFEIYAPCDGLGGRVAEPGILKDRTDNLQQAMAMTRNQPGLYALDTEDGTEFHPSVGRIQPRPTNA